MAAEGICEEVALQDVIEFLDTHRLAAVQNMTGGELIISMFLIASHYARTWFSFDVFLVVLDFRLSRAMIRQECISSAEHALSECCVTPLWATSLEVVKVDAGNGGRALE